MKKLILALGILILSIPASAAMGSQPTPTPVTEDELTPDIPTATPLQKLTRTPWVTPTDTVTPPPPTEVFTPTSTATPFIITQMPTATWTPIATWTPTLPPPDFVTCDLNLSLNNHTCDGIAEIRMIVPPSGGEAVVEIDLDPAKTAYRRVAFDLFYAYAPQGMTLNIGDSATNNGYGGDAATQSNDAELQVVDASLSVYGNDITPRKSRNLLNLPRFAYELAVSHIVVSNERIEWGSAVSSGEILTDSYLYALNGQADSEGPVNYKIYAAFNRSISTRDRNGSGLRGIIIFLLH